MAETRTQILDLAERAVRTRGYHAVSFRDLADALGIKSASIHYHFRRKEDLGAAIVDRYASRIAEQLGPAGKLPWAEARKRFVDVYRDALRQSELQCLCGLLAAESPGLPASVADRVAEYFRTNLTWLSASMPDDITDKPGTATRIQAQIQGAMTLSISLGDPSILDDLGDQICRNG